MATQRYKRTPTPFFCFQSWGSFLIADHIAVWVLSALQWVHWQDFQQFLLLPTAMQHPLSIRERAIQKNRKNPCTKQLDCDTVIYPCVKDSTLLSAPKEVWKSQSPSSSLFCSGEGVCCKIPIVVHMLLTGQYSYAGSHFVEPKWGFSSLLPTCTSLITIMHRQWS